MSVYVLTHKETGTFDLGWDMKHGFHVNVYPTWSQEDVDPPIRFRDIPDRFRSDVRRQISLVDALSIWWYWRTCRDQKAYRRVNALENVSATPFPDETPNIDVLPRVDSKISTSPDDDHN